MQTEYNAKFMKQGDAIGETLTMLKALNGKVDVIKVNADINDDYVKTQVDLHMQCVTEKLTALSQAGHATWSELESVKLK